MMTETMKTFKSISILLVASVISMAVLSCSKYESPLSGKTVADLKVESSFSTQIVSVEGIDLTGFTATSSESWCDVSAGVNGISVAVKTNDTYDDRQATVTVTDTEDGTFLTFRVIQKQKDAIKFGDRYEIPEEGGQFKIEVESNISYSVEIPEDCDWLTHVSSTRGLSTSEIVLNASKNKSGDDRKTKIKLVNSESGTTAEAEIVQILKPYLTIEEKTCSIKKDGGVIEVVIETNADYTLTCNENWVTIGDKEEVEGEDNKYIQKFVVSKYIPIIYYNVGSARYANVMVSVETSRRSLYEIIQIEQKVGLYINNYNVEIKAGEQFQLKLVNFTDQKVEWSSSNTSIVTVDSSGKIKGISEGKADISVKTSDGEYTDTIGVTIKGKVEETINNDDEGNKQEEQKPKSDISVYMTSYSGSNVGGDSQESVSLSLYNSLSESITINSISAYSSNKSLSVTTLSSSTVSGGSYYNFSISNTGSSFLQMGAWTVEITYTKSSNGQRITKKFYKKAYSFGTNMALSSD